MSFFWVCLPLAGVYDAYTISNFAGKRIVDILIIMSVLVWSIMITKYRELRAAEKMSARFLAAYRKEGHPAALFLKRQKYDPSPLCEIYNKTCQALGSRLELSGAKPDDLFMGAVSDGKSLLGDVQVNSIRSVAEQSMADGALLLEKQMGMLAQATTTAPYLGLLGTVWGVMEAFGQISSAGGGATLAAVAPGVSGALLTTVVGLVVALPSSIGYNTLAGGIRRLSVEMDNFTQELMSDIETQYKRS